MSRAKASSNWQIEILRHLTLSEPAHGTVVRALPGSAINVVTGEHAFTMVHGA